MKQKTVLITGARGPLGQALWARFDECEDCHVLGVDKEDYDLSTNHGISCLASRGPWDIVINNAKVEGWHHVEVLSQFAKEAVVNVSSIYGVLGSDPRLYSRTRVEMTPSWYAAEKAAMIGLTRWFATANAPVRYNAVIPGGIYRGQSKAFRERYEAGTPLKRMATEEDIVEPIFFLASPAAGYITGTTLVVDGGRSAW